MPIIEMPDGTQVEFPNDMPREKIRELIASKFPDEVKGVAEPAKTGRISLPFIGEPSLIGMAKGIGRAVSLPSEVYRGEVDPLSKEGIARTTELAGLTSPMAPGRGLAARPIQAAPDVPTPLPQEVISAGGALMREAEASPIAIDPRAVFNLVTATRNKLVGGHGPVLAKGVHDELALLQKSAQDALRAGRPLTAPDMVQYRSALTRHSEGKPSATTSAAGSAKNTFDNWLRENAPTLAATMDEATGNFRAGHLAAEVAAPVNRANIGAQTANSGMNVENRIRSTLGNIVAKEKERELHGWRQRYSPEARAAIEEAAIPTFGENLQRAASNVMGGGGGIGAGAYGVTAALSNPWLAAVPAAGAGLKTLANKTALEKADAAVRRVLEDSPFMKRARRKAKESARPRDVGGLLGLLNRNPGWLYPTTQVAPLQLTVRPSDRR